MNNGQPQKQNDWAKWAVRWLVGILWGALVAVIIFMGNVVKANDEKTTKEFTSVHKEISDTKDKITEKVDKKLEKIQDDVTDLKVQIAQVLEAVKK